MPPARIRAVLGFMGVVGLPGNGWRMALSMFLTTTSTRADQNSSGGFEVS
jgi:hypothetical protein